MGCTFGYYILTLRRRTKFPTDAIHNKILKSPKKGLYCIGGGGGGAHWPSG